MTEQQKKKSFLRRHWFAVSALVIGILVGGFFYLRYNGLENRYQQSMQEFEAQVQERYAEQRDALDSKVLGLTGEAFTWAVRKSMLVGNMDEVEQYIFGMVQSDDVLEVNVLDDQQTVIASSDQKLIETQFAVPGDQSLSVTDPLIITKDSAYLVITPITALTGHLGHTVIKYRIVEL